MAEEKTKVEKQKKLNLYQKLIKARKMFLDKNVKKTGYNSHQDFWFYTLADIVPPKTTIFVELGLVDIFYEEDDIAHLDLFNVEDPQEKPICFKWKITKAEQIFNKNGNAVTQPIQADGSTKSYYRRYLYLDELDIVEQEIIDSSVNENSVVKPTYVSQEQRESIKEDLVNANGKADELQIEGLKNLLSQLVEKDSNYQDFVDQLTMTTDNFTNITKADCETLIKKVNDRLNGVSDE